jgi:hypothetical protein
MSDQLIEGVDDAKFQTVGPCGRAFVFWCRGIRLRNRWKYDVYVFAGM